MFLVSVHATDDFPASRGLLRRGKNEKPLPASDAFPVTHALAFP